MAGSGSGDTGDTGSGSSSSISSASGSFYASAQRIVAGGMLFFVLFDRVCIPKHC